MLIEVLRFFSVIGLIIGAIGLVLNFLFRQAMFIHFILKKRLLTKETTNKILKYGIILVVLGLIIFLTSGLLEYFLTYNNINMAGTVVEIV